MNNTDGLAETELQSLMGLKLPVVIDQTDLQTYKSYGLSGFDKQAIKRATENPVVYQILLSRENNQIDEDIGGDSNFFRVFRSFPFMEKGNFPDKEKSNSSQLLS